VTESGAFSKFGRTRETIENDSSKKLAQFLLVARGHGADSSACRCPACGRPADLCESICLRKQQTLPGRVGVQGEVGPRRRILANLQEISDPRSEPRAGVGLRNLLHRL